MPQVFRMRSSRAFYESLSMVLSLLALPAVIELGASFPVPRYVYLGLGVTGCAVLWFWSERRWTARATTALLFVAALACLHLGPWSSRKVFVAKFQEIEPGMELETVHEMLRSYAFRENRSTPRHLERTYRHVSEGRYDSDFGVITFQDHRVVRTQFVPD